jgi:hypothetical protein
MNLNALVSGIIGAVNPDIIGTVKASTGGYTTAGDGTRTPLYRTSTGVRMQVQALDGKELAQVDSLNIEGEKRGVWLDGNLLGVVAAKEKGGDLLIFGGSTWLVIKVFETWATGWCHVAVALQKDQPA